MVRSTSYPNRMFFFKYFVSLIQENEICASTSCVIFDVAALLIDHTSTCSTFEVVNEFLYKYARSI